LSNVLRAVSLAAGLAFILILPVLAFSPVHAETNTPSVAVTPNLSDKNANWAGYGDVAIVPGDVGQIKISFKVPTATCDPLLSQPQAAFIFAGIDGVSGTSDFVYVGIEIFCAQGAPVNGASYSAVSTGTSGTIQAITVHAGDVIAAQVVHELPSVIQYNFVDVQSGGATDQSSATGVAFNSAESVIASGQVGGSKIPVVQFSRAEFGHDFVPRIGHADYATIAPTGNGPFGTFPATTATLVKYIMTNNAGTATDASPSAMSADGTSFHIAWKNAGP
jgi:hypothetical protein